jgi:hypothetical protein
MTLVSMEPDTQPSPHPGGGTEVMEAEEIQASSSPYTPAVPWPKSQERGQAGRAISTSESKE